MCIHFVAAFPKNILHIINVSKVGDVPYIQAPAFDNGSQRLWIILPPFDLLISRAGIDQSVICRPSVAFLRLGYGTRISRVIDPIFWARIDFCPPMGGYISPPDCLVEAFP